MGRSRAMWGTGPYSDMGCHHWAWWMSLHGLIGLLVLGGVIVGVVLLIRALGGRASVRADRRRALEVLEERYARGEIGRDEYLEKKQDLS